MKLWTVTEDYFATGEGRTLMGFIGYAENENEAIKKFRHEFGKFFAKGAKAQVGVIENDVTKNLFTKEAMKFMREKEGQANLVLVSKMHFNFS